MVSIPAARQASAGESQCICEPSAGILATAEAPAVSARTAQAVRAGPGALVSPGPRSLALGQRMSEWHSRAHARHVWPFCRSFHVPADTGGSSRPGCAWVVVGVPPVHGLSPLVSSFGLLTGPLPASGGNAVCERPGSTWVFCDQSTEVSSDVFRESGP